MLTAPGIGVRRRAYGQHRRESFFCHNFSAVFPFSRIAAPSWGVPIIATAEHGPDGIRKEVLMEASSGRSRTRHLAVDFLATLFVTFCIGVVTALVLAACVMLMAGDAHGPADATPL